MACSSSKPPKKAPKKLPPFPGEAGFLKVTYIGDDEMITQFGQATRAKYDFVPGQPMNVDRRDAIYILGAEFEVQ